MPLRLGPQFHFRSFSGLLSRLFVPDGQNELITVPEKAYVPVAVDIADTY
jgi:hypothetical protein